MIAADISSDSRFYVPEVHDVYPGMENVLDQLYGAWPADAEAHVATLVVPNWQGRHPPDQAKHFVDRVAGLPGEKILHGFTHSLGPDIWNWLLYGHDNRSEFAALGHEEATSRIAKGVDVFKAQFGKAPRWFCAPRWHQNTAATEALRAAGFKGYMLRGSLKLFSGTSAELPSLCFDEGGRRVKTIPARLLRELTINRLFASGQPFRVTLHPDDVKDAASWRQVGRVMARLANEGWKPVGPDEAIRRFGKIPASASTGTIAQA